MLNKVRPNILWAISLIAILGIVISWMGWRMGAEGLMSGAGIGAIVGIGNLAGKIMEGE
jgi:hypothetical protein